MTAYPRPVSSGHRVLRGLAALTLALGLFAGMPVAASAIPPDGAGPDTAGTSSRVWPAQVKAGDRLYFEVSGYPANETVYIKIDDGNMCSDTSHGACVYHTQKLNKKGYAKGSLVVPELAPGKHWLRMLATGDVFDSKTGERIGYQGYTRRGGNTFTVVSGGSSSKDTGGSGTSAGGGAVNSDGTVAGGSVELDLGEESPSPEASATPAETVTPVETVRPAETASAEPAAQSPTPAAAPPASLTPPGAATATGLPVAGIATLAGSVVLGGGAVGWALARRNRLRKLAAAGEG